MFFASFPDKFTYVEGWKSIQLANQIFGFNGWSSSVVDVTPDFVRRFLSLYSFCYSSYAFLYLFQIEDDSSRVRVGVTAIVRVTLKDGTFHEVLFCGRRYLGTCRLPQI